MGNLRPVAGSGRWILPDERRAHPRVQLRVEVGVKSDSNFYMGFSENLSEGGIFVATAEEAAVGEVFDVQFKLPGTPRPLSALCEVRWLRPECADAAAGMGLRFLYVDPETQALIERFLTTRDPLFYDED